MDANVAVADSAEVPSDDSAPAATYRPHLDGLRAVAVYLVVLFHAGIARFSGGYVGVDVFFVLSGFLVTQLLLRDVARSGSIRFGRFYSRRFRRLLPAAFVALLVTALVFTAIASPAEVAAAAGSFKAAFLYSTNWYFVHQATGYFGANITTNPVLHFWSLAVEEQFYLVWPLLLAAAFALTRRMDRDRQLRAIRIAVVVAALASAIWALSLRTTNPNHAYYGTDTRAYELLAGAFLALTPALFDGARRARNAVRVATVVAAAVLLALASSWLGLNAITRGVAVTITVAALIVTLEVGDGGIVKRALSNRTVVYLGRVSYGTYLWHWIVILVVIRTFHAAPGATFGITVLVATGLAALSYEVLEHPVRASRLLDRHRIVVIASGLAISGLSALVIIPAVVTPARAAAPVVHGTTAGFTPVPANIDLLHPSAGRGTFVNCYRKKATTCILVHGTGPHVMLIGDSHAQMLIPPFVELAHTEHLTLSVSVQGACPWQRDLRLTQLVVDGRAVSLDPSRCDPQRNDLYSRVIPLLHPDAIVAVDSPGYDTRHASTLSASSLASLRALVHKVVLVEPIPAAPFDPVVCLSGAKVLEQCRYVASSAPDPFTTAYRDLARHDHNVFSADFDRLVCPFFPICDPVVNGRLVKYNASHITPAFAKTLAPPIDEYLKQVGVIPR